MMYQSNQATSTAAVIDPHQSVIASTMGYNPALAGFAGGAGGGVMYGGGQTAAHNMPYANAAVGGAGGPPQQSNSPPLPQGPPNYVATSPWRYWPATRADAAKIEVPVGVLFSPFAEGSAIQLVRYEPIKSRQGGCILNPTCHVDYRAKIWNDPISGARNAFPPNYANHISENNVPAELIHSSIEYVLPPLRPAVAPTYIFVIDINLYSEELDSLKDSLQQVLGLLPPESSVGLVTFGTVVDVHELGFTEGIRKHAFKGNKVITRSDVQTLLKIGAGPPNLNKQPQPSQQLPRPATQAFVCPLASAEGVFNTIVEDLRKDGWPVPADQRVQRCTGAALSVAVSLMEIVATHQPGRILLFVGGVCTSGPGQIVANSLSESIRQHLDLQKDTPVAKLSKAATKFYSELANRAVAVGHGIDLFCCALDQCGLFEMKVCAEKTGGIVVMSDTFSLNVFKDSLRKLFETGPDGYTQDAYDCKIELLTSKEIKIAGAVGCVTSSNKKTPQVAELTVGQSGTCEWTAGVMDRNSTVAFYLEVCNTNAAAVKGKMAYLQFQTSYTHPNGDRRIRVHTLSYPFSDGGTAHLGSGFDQEAATVMMARLAVSRAETEEPLDILRWVDRKLIRLVSVFADYQKDKPESFQLGVEFAFYPTFMYHLRRSHFLQTFNTSPDETGFYRTCLLRESMNNTITMISPCLFEYTLQAPYAVAVELDSKALKPSVILLLDSFFHLVIWHGDQIARWKEQGFHEQETYRHVKTLLEAPLEDARRILLNRLPCPKFVICNSGGSQARFLLAKVNPSSTTEQQAYGEFGDSMAGGRSTLTEDVNMKTFMEHLVKLSVLS